MKGRRVTVVDAIWCALGVLLAVGLVLPPSKTGEGLGLRRFRTVDVSGDYWIAQRFRMNAPDLTGVEIRPVAVGPVSGRYRLTIRDRDARNVERSTDVAAADLVRESRYRFRFEPIADSVDHEYQLEIAPAADDPGRGVALWANKGARVEGSALRINNAPRWASLAYQTETPTMSPLRSLLAPGDPERPPRWLALVGLLGSWIALRFVLHGLAAAQDDPDALRSAAITAPPGPGVDASSSPSTQSADAPERPQAAIR